MVTFDAMLVSFFFLVLVIWKLPWADWIALSREDLLVVRSLALVMVSLVCFRDKGKGSGEAGPFIGLFF